MEIKREVVLYFGMFKWRKASLGVSNWKKCEELFVNYIKTARAIKCLIMKMKREREDYWRILTYIQNTLGTFNNAKYTIWFLLQLWFQLPAYKFYLPLSSVSLVLFQHYGQEIVHKTLMLSFRAVVFVSSRWFRIKSTQSYYRL